MATSESDNFGFFESLLHSTRRLIVRLQQLKTLLKRLLDEASLSSPPPE
jgi:hypothetical protein